MVHGAFHVIKKLKKKGCPACPVIIIARYNNNLEKRPVLKAPEVAWFMGPSTRPHEIKE
jgi:hypothetical protein